MKNLSISLFILALALLPAQAAELTADKMEFTKGAQVATGNAELKDKDLLLKASKISYQNNIAHAEGNITMKREDLLITGNTLDYRLDDGSFIGKKLQVGKWPVYLEADEVTGDKEKYEAKGAVFFYGEPELYSPSIRASRIGYVAADKRYEIESPWIQVGKRKILKLPGFTLPEKGYPFGFVADAGNRSSTGIYAVIEPAVLGKDNFRFTPGLGLYQERGLMLKPGVDYNFGKDGIPFGEFETSWIQDHGDAPTLYDTTLPDNRYFISWKHRRDSDDNLETKVKLNWLSDADYLRDYEPDFFHDDFADSFTEASYYHNHYLFSVFTRLEPDDLQSFPRRLPEVRADLLASPIGNTPVIQRGHAAMAWLEEDGVPIHSTRFDAYYGLSHKFTTPSWFSFSPLAGVRVTKYLDNNQYPESFTRTIGELGVDAGVFSHGDWAVDNSVWKIEGLRHIIKAVAQYRYIPESEKGSGKYAVMERSLLQHNMPLLGLGMLPYIDELGDQHLVRLGLENRFDTKSSGYGSRKLAQFNLYQDIFPDRPDNQLEALYVNFLVSPAHWIDLALTGKLPSESGKLSRLGTGIILRDGDKADLYFANEYETGGSQQNSAYLTYQANRDNLLAVGLRHDSDKNRFIEQVYTWSRSVGKNWILDNTLVYRDGDLRESDFTYRVGLRLRGY